jgi:hypothetical protein
LLLQAVQHLSGVDSADQDLFASLSMALAAVGAPDSDLQEIRWGLPAQCVVQWVSKGAGHSWIEMAGFDVKCLTFSCLMQLKC